MRHSRKNRKLFENDLRHIFWIEVPAKTRIVVAYEIFDDLIFCELLRSESHTFKRCLDLRYPLHISFFHLIDALMIGSYWCNTFFIRDCRPEVLKYSLNPSPLDARIFLVVKWYHNIELLSHDLSILHEVLKKLYIFEGLCLKECILLGIGTIGELCKIGCKIDLERSHHDLNRKTQGIQHPLKWEDNRILFFFALELKIDRMYFKNHSRWSVFHHYKIITNLREWKWSLRGWIGWHFFWSADFIGLHENIAIEFFKL